jgi:hypothetical protein
MKIVRFHKRTSKITHLLQLRLLLRFCVELIETRVLVSESFVELLERTLPLISNLEEVAELPRCEFYLGVILDVIPFAGRMLFNRHKKVLLSLLETVSETIRKREQILPLATRKLLTIFHNNITVRFQIQIHMKFSLIERGRY